MNLFTGEASDAFFGGAVPSMVRRLLDEARGASPMELESLLWTAQATAPQCLPVYYLLYKFYAQRMQFESAEKVALKALTVAAVQANLSVNWRHVQPGDAAFSSIGPARFWLFSLKALAFIYLRAQRHEDSRELVAKLQQLDPNHGVGSDVISALLDGVDDRDKRV